jgi:hypothetical protein
MSLQDKFDKLVSSISQNILKCCKFLYIRDKETNLVELSPNYHQKKLWEKVQEDRKNEKPGRYIILKGRQFGISTFIEAIIFMLTTFNRGKNALVAANEPDATANIFKMFKRYYENLPDFEEGFTLKRSTKYSNKREIVWKTHDGGMQVITAHKDNPSGSTIHYLHLSEVPKMKNPDVFIDSILQMVPDYWDTAVFVEGTANGIGGRFHADWIRAINGESEYTPIFMAWFFHHEYKLPGESWKTVNASKSMKDARELPEVGEYIDNLINNHKCTAPQIAWWLKTFRNKCRSNIDLMMQEYPASWQEAFIASGACVFDVKILKDWEGKLRDHKNYKEYNLQKYNREWKPGLSDDVQGWVFDGHYEEAGGGLKIYEEVSQDDYDDQRYSIGVDPAEGLEHGDNSSVFVLDRKTGEFVAEFTGKSNPERVTHIAIWLGYRYNQAQICTEVNNHGHTVVKTLVDLEYPNLFMRENIDKFEKKKSEIIGFRTTSLTKALLIDDFAKAFRDGLKPNSYELLTEMFSFHEENGKMAAVSGCKDDRVMAAALAWRNSQDMGSLKPQEEEREELDFGRGRRRGGSPTPGKPRSLMEYNL